MMLGEIARKLEDVGVLGVVMLLGEAAAVLREAGTDICRAR